MKQPPPHGTEARYQQHRRSYGTPCQPCKDAHALASRMNRAARLNLEVCEHGYIRPHRYTELAHADRWSSYTMTVTCPGVR